MYIQLTVTTLDDLQHELGLGTENMLQQASKEAVSHKRRNTCDTGRRD